MHPSGGSLRHPRRGSLSCRVVFRPSCLVLFSMFLLLRSIRCIRGGGLCGCCLNVILALPQVPVVLPGWCPNLLARDRCKICASDPLRLRAMKTEAAGPGAARKDADSFAAHFFQIATWHHSLFQIEASVVSAAASDMGRVWRSRTDNGGCRHRASHSFLLCTTCFDCCLATVTIDRSCCSQFNKFLVMFFCVCCLLMYLGTTHVSTCHVKFAFLICKGRMCVFEIMCSEVYGFKHGWFSFLFPFSLRSWSV